MSEIRPHLYEVHVELGAKMVPFGGWLMPLHYGSGTVHEHLSCRRDAVVFDVSHLGTIRCEGPDAREALQRTLTNDLDKIAPGRAQYTHLLNDDGGVVDDIIVWWVDRESFDVMPNATNTSGVTAVLAGQDVTRQRSVLAVQGPEARRKVARVDPRFAEVGRFRVARFDYLGHEVRVAGTGYTGEDGVEIAIEHDGAEELLRALVNAEIVPAGLGARDTLRLEAALPLYGHELSLTTTTLEAGLGWVIGWNKATFLGRDAVVAERERGVLRHLVGVLSDSRQPLREGAELLVDAQVVGTLTSGNYSPILERGVALGFVDRSLEVDTPLDVSLRGRRVAARIAPLPFVTKER